MLCQKKPFLVLNILSIGLLISGMGGCASGNNAEPSLIVDESAADKAELMANARAYQANTDDLLLLIAYSRSLRDAGRGDEAVRILTEDNDKFGSDPDYLTELGKAYLVAKNFAAARSTLSSALAADQDNWQALATLGILEDLEEKHLAAQTSYNRALNMCPNSAAILNNLAVSESYVGDFEQSAQHLNRALALQPLSLRIHQNSLTLTQLRSRCPSCSREQASRLARALYAQDWTSTSADLTCSNNIVVASRLETELNENDFIDMRVLFAFDSAELTPEAREALDQLAEAMKAESLSGYAFRLEGHTDARGTDEYNMDLSERRAASVKDYLTNERGIDARRLQSIGFGESQLANPEDPESGVNRRVRVIKTGEFIGGAIAGL